jgi:hypothetical protein
MFAEENRMKDSPLAEVFGFTVSDQSPEAIRYRKNRLCPFNNRVPSCTKDKANDPLGVCSILHHEKPVITCPIRFRQDWLIAEHASNFFFSAGTHWTSLSEVRLRDQNGIVAGNIDLVLVAYDDHGDIIDFGAVEVQAVYISGNVRNHFESFINTLQATAPSPFVLQPRPDYLSSSRKRLAPQLLFKGGILKSWGKRQAVALQRPFFENLPTLPPVAPEKADIAWLVYDLILDHHTNRYQLTLTQTVFTEFQPALEIITQPIPGSLNQFIETLQARLDDKLQSGPDAPPFIDLGET